MVYLTAPTVSGLFSGLSGVTTGIFDMVSDVTAAVVGNPILLVGIGISFLGLAIGLFKKFI